MSIKKKIGTLKTAEKEGTAQQEKHPDFATGRIASSGRNTHLRRKKDQNSGDEERSLRQVPCASISTGLTIPLTASSLLPNR